MQYTLLLQNAGAGTYNIDASKYRGFLIATVESGAFRCSNIIPKALYDSDMPIQCMCTINSTFYGWQITSRTDQSITIGNVQGNSKAWVYG